MRAEIAYEPAYAKEFEFIVAKEGSREMKFFFYGAYDDVTKACAVAKEIDGLVFRKGDERVCNFGYNSFLDMT